MGHCSLLLTENSMASCICCFIFFNTLPANVCALFLHAGDLTILDLPREECGGCRLTLEFSEIVED